MRILWAAIAVVVFFGISVCGVRAESVRPDVVIADAKITSSEGQFVLLYNQSGHDIANMAAYRLQYFNHYDVSQMTSSKSIQLSGALPADGYYLISDDALSLCFPARTQSASLGFSTTNGMIQLEQMIYSDTGPVATNVQDYMRWAKKPSKGAMSAGVQLIPSDGKQFLSRRPLDSRNNPTVDSASSQSWAVVQFGGGCEWQEVVTRVAAPPTPKTTYDFMAGSPPDATIISIENESEEDEGPVMPAANIGLKAPVITELLPNPKSPQTDAEDEFIELYNSNDRLFDLSGFKLQVGTETKRTFTFPAGVVLPAKGFRAFLSIDTHLALSNSGSQVALLDPFGKVIASAEAYQKAGEGKAWALAKGSWYWTQKPTPGQANIIENAFSGSSANLSSASKQFATASSSRASSDQNGTVAAATDKTSSSLPIHPAILAGAICFAVLYAAYEYRHDFANRLHRFRTYRKTRRAHRA